MKIPLNREVPSPSRFREMVILFTVADQTFAIAADSVQEIRSTDSLAGAANEIADPESQKVRHTLERLHRTYYVVNAGVHYGLPVTRPGLVLILREHPVAVLIDRIERMTEISSVYPLPRLFTSDERRWYRGLAYVDDAVVPVIRPSGYLTQEELAWLDRATGVATSAADTKGAVQA